MSPGSVTRGRGGKITCRSPRCNRYATVFEAGGARRASTPISTFKPKELREGIEAGSPTSSLHSSSRRRLRRRLNHGIGRLFSTRFLVMARNWHAAGALRTACAAGGMIHRVRLASGAEHYHIAPLYH